MIGKAKVLLVGTAFCCLFSGCALNQNITKYEKVDRTVAKYEDMGMYWGKTLLKDKMKPGDELDAKFVKALIEDIDYFKVHSDLKDAFKKGFRVGYEDRIADLVLGPHVTSAAGQIGGLTADNFVKVVESFETGWNGTLGNAVDVFIVLIAEGSQADRQTFIDKFTEKYDSKYKKTQKILSSNEYMKQVSEGGTILFINRMGALDIPKPASLKAEIYHQAFTAMGDEWGRRFSTNLIKRDELIDVIRRSKQALMEVEGDNLGYIHKSFVKSYGDDAEEVFESLTRDAGFGDKFVSKTIKSKK